MADPFGTFAVGQLTMQPDCLLLGEILLLEFELRGEIEQSQLLLFFGDDFIEESQMVAEEDDRGGIVDLGIFADVTLEENGGHRGDVLVAEAQVGPGEAGAAGLNAGDADVISPCTGPNHVARENLFGDGHWAALVCSLDGRQEYFALQACYVERK